MSHDTLTPTTPDSDDTTNEPLPEDTLPKFVEDIETVLARKETLRTVLADLDKQRLRGDPVQSDLSSVLKQEDALYRVGRLANKGLLSAALEQAEAADHLDETTRDRFESFWNSVAWITPGITGYKIDDTHVPLDYTNQEVDIEFSAHGLGATVTIHNGVDTRCEVAGPVRLLYQDALRQLGRYVEDVTFAAERGAADAATVETVIDSRSVLVDLLEWIDRLAQASPDTDTELDESDVPDGSGSWESVFADRPDDAEDTDHGRGFQ